MAREPIKKITLKSGEVRYRFVTDAPRGPDGKRRQVTHTFDTLREARDALAKIRTESSTGRYVHPDKTTLDEYLSEWLAAIGRGVEPGTLRAYQDALRVPRELLGHRKLRSINSADVNAVVEFMLTKGRKKGGPADTGLGPRSVQMMLTVLRRAFQEAVRDRKMTWNPAEGVRGPRLRPRKVTPWTDDEVRAFMDAARRDRLHAIWRLSLLALRPEEVAGLRWDSVDLTACTLTVARVQVIVAGKVLERETAKTPAGERTLPSTRARSRRCESCVSSSAKNGWGPERRTGRAVMAATSPPMRSVPVTARSGYAAPSIASWSPPGSAGSPSTTLVTPRSPTCSTRVRCRSRWWPPGPDTLTAARPRSSTTSASGRATSKPPGTPSPGSSARERFGADVRNYERSAANDRS